MLLKIRCQVVGVYGFFAWDSARSGRGEGKSRLVRLSCSLVNALSGLFRFLYDRQVTVRRILSVAMALLTLGHELLRMNE